MIRNVPVAQPTLSAKAPEFTQAVVAPANVAAAGVDVTVNVPLVVGPAQLDEFTQASVYDSVVPEALGVTLAVKLDPDAVIPGDVLARLLPTGQLATPTAVNVVAVVQTGEAIAVVMVGEETGVGLTNTDKLATAVLEQPAPVPHTNE